MFYYSYLLSLKKFLMFVLLIHLHLYYFFLNKFLREELLTDNVFVNSLKLFGLFDLNNISYLLNDFSKSILLIFVLFIFIFIL